MIHQNPRDSTGGMKRGLEGERMDMIGGLYRSAPNVPAAVSS